MVRLLKNTQDLIFADYAGDANATEIVDTIYHGLQL